MLSVPTERRTLLSCGLITETKRENTDDEQAQKPIDRMTKLIHPLTFIDKLVKKNELGQPFRLMDHQREVLRLAFAFDQDGRLPWDTIASRRAARPRSTAL